MTRNHPRRLAPALLALALASCGGRNTPPQVEAPGHARSGKTKALEAGAAIMQDKTPVDQVHLYVCGFHFYNGAGDRQVEAHHYCILGNDEFNQCLIFDGNGKDAKLIGIEYIISGRLFGTLPDDERRLWHSHDYEVKSGALIAPGLPEAAEHELMAKLVSTYGKTIHTWQVDRGDKLPLGIPRVMMGLTRDGQLRPELAADRDKRFNISTAARRKSREDIPAPAVLPGANAWERGDVAQLGLTGGTPAPAQPPAGR